MPVATRVEEREPHGRVPTARDEVIDQIRSVYSTIKPCCKIYLVLAIVSSEV